MIHKLGMPKHNAHFTPPLTPLPLVEGISWPAIPTPRAAGFMAMQYQLDQSQWLPPDEILRRQLAQAAIVLRHALDTVPHYRDKYAGWHPGDRLDEAAWRRLPLLERGEIQEHFEQLRSTRLPASHGKIMTYGSSGSTGRPIQALGTETTHFFWLALGLRDHLWHRRDFSKKHGAIRSKVERANTPGWAEWADSFASGPSAMLNIQTDIDTQLDWLLAEAPDYLITHPSNLQALVERSNERGIRPAGLREVRTFGEMLKPDLRAQVRDAWGIPLSDLYSAEELGYIALQCPESEHYHIQAENLLVEVLREDGTPCAPGEIGMVVVTTLHNFAMPLIRYRLLDYAEAGEPCHCGRGLPVIRRIVGRQRNMITLPDGRRHWPSFPGSAWLAIAPIRQFQLVQEDLQTIRVRMVCPRPLTAEEEDMVRRMLTGKLRYPFQFVLEYPASIEPGPNRKFEDFVSRLA
ncbi:MAG: hypothetical protein PHX38_03425 [Sulfuricella sp.]|nr:hypothetical protein [Sulfuricella sp.]